jgi:hypothetical protein
MPGLFPASTLLAQLLQEISPNSLALGGPSRPRSTTPASLAPAGGTGNPFALTAGGAFGGSSGAYDFTRMFGNVPTLEGVQKWSGGGNSTDVFTPDNTTVYAPFSGQVQTIGTMNGPVLGYLVMLTDPRTGFSMRLVHTQPVAAGYVQAGQPLARVHDDGMNLLRWPGGQYGNAPSGYQHAQVDFANSPGGFRDGPMGGTLDAERILQGGGFRPTQLVPRTPGPPEGMGMGGGLGMPGMGMSPLLSGLFGSGPGGGLPGLPGGLFGGGMPPMLGGMGGPPLMGGGVFGGMPPMMGPPMLPPMFGGGGFGGFGSQPPMMGFTPRPPPGPQFGGAFPNPMLGGPSPFAGLGGMGFGPFSSGLGGMRF